MIKRIVKNIIFFFLVIASLAAESQNMRVVDSLKTVLKTAKADTVKLSALLAISYEYQGEDPDKALDYGEKALQLAEGMVNKKGIGKALNNLGDLYWYRADYLASSQNYLRALKIFESMGNKKEIANCYRNIGWVYYNQNDLKSALDYYNKSLAMNLEIAGNNENIAANYNDIGIIYTHTKQYDKAVEIYKKALKLQEQIGNKMGMAANYGNLSIVYEKMGKKDLAIDNVERGVLLARQTGNKQYLSISLCNLGSSYGSMGRTDEALKLLYEALAIAKELNYKEALKNCYENLAATYRQRNDYENAYKYRLMLVHIKDSIYNASNSQQINEMTAKYDSEKKELVISSLEKDNTLASEKIERERYFKICLSIFCLMIAGFAFMLFRGNVNKKKANGELSYAYKEIEIKNKDITDSINYSKRIQDASLPPRELKYRLFPDAFVLFQPKDIVSGDFYWFGEKDGKRIIAACDCTGHGVPGALMSMIGNNILNSAIYEKGIVSAGKILDHLHLEIRKALKQNEHPENRDGMDIAILVFHSEREVEFAGAQRPLWLIKEKEMQLEEIKGNKFSIGGIQTEETRTFDTHRMILQPKDCLYIFSDGIVDQFGGEHGKKFMTKSLKTLLTTISDEPMAIQENIVSQTIGKWRGSHEQVDDILVIGIKI